jgi:hypothetical protein
VASTQKQWERLPDEPESAPEPQEDKHLSLLLLGLKTLSQRALTAISDLFTLVTVFGAWWLWHETPDPNPAQIVSLSIFAAFVLAANWLVRRR